MSDLVNFEYPAPRSWEQFEELCADLFEAMWSDPRLVRHGRSGQAQNGVDIVTTYGGSYPIGLQCKKKSQWPIKTLTKLEVNQEIKAAEKFVPKLKEFYILTTAASDQAIQQHVRELNEGRSARKEFLITVLFWSDIVRKVGLFEQVARKHFPIRGFDSGYSPLLATFFVENGRLELTEFDLQLAVNELGEDFHDWPTGHVNIRQRETNLLMQKLQKTKDSAKSEKARSESLTLRRQLRNLRKKEDRAQEIIRFIYTNETLKFYVMELDESGKTAAVILNALIESELGTAGDIADYQKIRVAPPTPYLLLGPRIFYSVADDDLAISITDSEYMEVLNREHDFQKKFGNKMTKEVCELPFSVRARRALPQIIRRIDRVMREEAKSVEEMRLAGYLDLGRWRYSH